MGVSYTRMLKGLLPKGIAWAAPPESNLYRLLDALSQELLRVDQAVTGIMDDADPATTDTLLSEWERVVGIPDECTGIADNLGERRIQALARLAARGGQSRQYFIDLAASLGFTITIDEFHPFLVGMGTVGEPLANGDWNFAWRVNTTFSGGETHFRAGVSHAGDRIREFGNDVLECIINRYKPAHTTVLFAYHD